MERLLNRIKQLFTMGLVTRAETTWIQVKLVSNVINDRVKRIHNYGFMSRPLPGANGYLLFVGGDTSRGVAVCVEDERYEIDLEPGDVAVLDYRGNLIHLKASGIDIHSPQAVTVNAPSTTINSETTINGTTEINGDTTINGQTIANGKVTNTGGVSVDGIEFDQHRHSENDQQGLTGTPQ